MENKLSRVFSKVYNLLNPYRGLTREIYIIAITRVISRIGRFVSPLLTLIMTKKIGMSETEVGLYMSLSGIFFMLSSVIGGKLTDKIGRKKIIMFCNSFGISFYLVAAVLGNSVLIVPCIFVSGFIMGIADPASEAMSADITNPKNRDSAYSLFYICINVGSAIGPMVGGLLFENFLWVMFVCETIAVLATTALIFVFIPETIGRTKEKMDKSRKLEERVEGSIFKILFQRPVLIFYALMMFGYNFVYSQFYFLYPMHAEQIIPGSGATFYGTLMTLNAVTVIIITPVFAKLLSKKSSLQKIFLGGIFYTIGFSIPGFIVTIPLMYVSTFVLTLGEIVVLTSSMPYIANRTPASHRGRMNAVLPLVMGLGFTIGPAIMGSTSEAIGMENSWKIIGTVMVFFTIYAYFLEKYDRRSSARYELEQKEGRTVNA